MGIKKHIINSGTIAYLLYRNLINSTIATLIIERLPITNHFGKASNTSFDKSSDSNKITWVEKDLILEKNDDIAETFNDFFISVASNLNIPRYKDPFTDSDQT